jgi:hypothetical protein
MPTFIGKPKTMSELAAAIYKNLPSDARKPEPPSQPSRPDWWNTPQYKAWEEGARARELQRTKRRT